MFHHGFILPKNTEPMSTNVKPQSRDNRHDGHVCPISRLPSHPLPGKPSKKHGRDRRIIRTRDAMRSALGELILEQGYAATTVSEVVERAAIARSTFYMHHASKESVLLECVGSLREHLADVTTAAVAKSGEPAPRLAFSLALFEHADHFRDLYQAHQKDESGPLVLDSIRQTITRLIRHELRVKPVNVREPGNVPREAEVRFTVEALLGVLTWWLEATPRLSPAEGDRIFRQLLGRS